MDYRLEKLVRSEAAKRLRVLVQVYGEEIPARELKKPIDFTYQGTKLSIPCLILQQGIYKPSLLESALSLRTSYHSPYNDDVDGQGRVVYAYRNNGIDSSDNRAMRMAMETKLPVLYFLGTQSQPDVRYIHCWVHVVEDHKHLQRVVLEAVQSVGENNALYHAIKEAAPAVPDEWPDERGYGLRTQLQRMHQNRFRKQVMAAYRHQCAVCRLKKTKLLDAAHILPDQHERGQPVIQNGLSLCKIHHAAYDANILGIDPECTIHIDEQTLFEHDGPMLLHGLQEMHGEAIVLPNQTDKKPDPERLAERFEEFLGRGSA